MQQRCGIATLLLPIGVSVAQIPFAQPSVSATNGMATSAQAFTFARVQWTGRSFGHGFAGRGNGPLWAHDYPIAEQNLYLAINALTALPITYENKIITLTDDGIFDFPFLYICEVGYWSIEEKEAKQLAEYLARGGFLLVDDFRGGFEWSHFLEQIKRVTPKTPQPLEVDHPIFHCFFDFDHLLGYAPYGGLTPRYYAIFDDKGRIMVMINHNNDIGDGWEWPEADEIFSTEAFKLGINYLIYSMTH
ncbi:MAG: DUF4159 domain-containing protein [candidate division KSB1 bacterium]|nr:DUF4159 domain-containing protein [candidate division KSB1 bacterium]